MWSNDPIRVYKTVTFVPQVMWAEQQHEKIRVKRGHFHDRMTARGIVPRFDDPLWDAQWYLVGSADVCSPVLVVNIVSDPPFVYCCALCVSHIQNLFVLEGYAGAPQLRMYSNTAVPQHCTLLQSSRSSSERTFHSGYAFADIQLLQSTKLHCYERFFHQNPHKRIVLHVFVNRMTSDLTRI